MTTITRATVKDAALLVDIGRASFIDSHGMSAPKKDIDAYLEEKFNEVTFSEELLDAANHFYILYYNDIPVGYSKMIFNFSHQNVPFQNASKLERLYLLKEYHHLKLGLELMNFNIKKSIEQSQAGIWLFVWIGNTQAFNFYSKLGFEIVGSYDFKISETHYNPNHQMLLTY